MRIRYKRKEVPTWARELIEEICRERAVLCPEVIWYESTTLQPTTGVARRTGRITIRAGGGEKDNLRVLLHEMAHHVEFRQTGKSNHGPSFYALCWNFYIQYKADLDLAIEREFYYKVSARPALEKLGIRLTPKQKIIAEAAIMRRGMRTLQSQMRTLANKHRRARSQKSLNSLSSSYNSLVIKHKLLQKKYIQKNNLLLEIAS